MAKGKKMTKVESDVENDEVEVEEIAEEVTEVVTADGQNLRTYVEICEELTEKLKQCAQMEREIRQLVKEKDRAHFREVKSARKNRKNNNSNKGSKEPSGFNKPGPVPKEFCSQPWGCDSAVQLPRTVLTKMVYDYIKEHNLQDPTDKRIIHPDKVIKNTFHLKEGDTLEFKTFQTHMAKLYNPDLMVENAELVEDSDDDEEELAKKQKKAAKKKKSKSAEASV